MTMMVMPTAPKRRKVGGAGGEEEEEEEDRFSQLPDSLIGHILSFGLSIREAARTCFLSKRWSRCDAWASVPDLDFVMDDPRVDVDFVEAVMSRRTADVRRFRLSLPRSWTGRPLSCQVESWVERALQLNARHVSIEMQHEEETEVRFLDALLSHGALESLELDLFMPDSLLEDGPVELRSRAALSRLRVLDINIEGRVCGESLRGLLHNCPVLEELSLGGWFDFLDVSSDSLKELRLTLEETSRTSISCPNLQSFTLYYDSYLQKGSESFHGHMPSLRSASVASGRGSAFMDQVVGSLANVPNKHIHIGNYYY